MKTKTIFKTVALAMLMPTMLLTTACSNDDDVVNNAVNTENTINKGYALPVTVNVTRQGDAATRATYTDNGDGTGSLAFSAGDKLFVYGSTTAAGSFAGALDYVPATGKFSGTIYTQEEWTGTADALFTAASAGENLTATLLPNGYDANGSNSFLSINNNSTTDIAYDDRLTVSYSKAFVASETAKATGVEQLSLERTSTYSNGFELEPQNAILNFTITGLEAGAKDVSLQLSGFDNTVTGSVTPNAGVATFAIGVSGGSKIKDMDNNLTVGSSNFTLPSSTTFAAGKIYNIARNAIPGALIGVFSVGDTKKVYFSKGNLQATTTDMGTSWTWAFAENQWDYIGGRSYGGSEPQTGNNFITGNKTVSANGTVDLFGWSTSTTYLGIHNSNNDGDYSGNFVDWGATMGTGWCTLSIDEWHYLFFTRSDAANKYGYATVNGVYGIIFLPDAFVDPNKNNGSNAFVGSTIDWNANLYTEDNWALMEKNGAVFLPAAGYREGADVDVAGDRGYYWSSSAYGDENAHYVYFSSDYLEVDDYDTFRSCGHSVRLVRPVQ